MPSTKKECNCKCHPIGMASFYLTCEHCHPQEKIKCGTVLQHTMMGAITCVTPRPCPIHDKNLQQIGQDEKPIKTFYNSISMAQEQQSWEKKFLETVPYEFKNDSSVMSVMIDCVSEIIESAKLDERKRIVEEIVWPKERSESESGGSYYKNKRVEAFNLALSQCQEAVKKVIGV